ESGIDARCPDEDVAARVPLIQCAGIVRLKIHRLPRPSAFVYSVTGNRAGTMIGRPQDLRPIRQPAPSSEPLPMPSPDTGPLFGTFAPGILAGQSAMITGGSRGIGRAAALALAAAGANVAIGYQRDEKAARLVCDEAAAKEVRAEAFAVDVAQP